jgi:hypothetical protein
MFQTAFIVMVAIIAASSFGCRPKAYEPTDAGSFLSRFDSAKRAHETGRFAEAESTFRSLANDHDELAPFAIFAAESSSLRRGREGSIADQADRLKLTIQRLKRLLIDLEMERAERSSADYLKAAIERNLTIAKARLAAMLDERAPEVNRPVDDQSDGDRKPIESSEQSNDGRSFPFIRNEKRERPSSVISQSKIERMIDPAAGTPFIDPGRLSREDAERRVDEAIRRIRPRSRVEIDPVP